MTAPGRRRNTASGLAAELAAAETSEEKPTESPVISMSQKELEALLDKARAEAVAQTKQDLSEESDEAPEFPQVNPSSPNSVTVHFLEDGHTALGRVWYRGDQVTVSKDSKEWQEDGKYWMNLTEYDQVRRYGRRIWAQGVWPYGGYDLDDPDLDPKDREQLKRANAQRGLHMKRRSRRSEMTIGA